MKIAVRLVIVVALIVASYMVYQSRSAAALNNEATALLNEARYPEAAAKLEKARKMAPKNAAIWRNLGVALEEQGFEDRALHAYTTALRLAPGQMDDVRARMERLQDNNRLRTAARARVERMKADGWVDDDATLAQTTTMAHASFQVGKYKDALLLYERALFKTPDDIELMQMIEELEKRLAQGAP
jgi:tetratricopeptide (TPR) repeat protein